MIGVPVPAICTGYPLPPRHLKTERLEEIEAMASHLETERLEETETMARHLERRAATETSIPDVGVPGGGILLPPGTAKRHRRPSSSDDRAWWKAGKGMIRRLLAPTFHRERRVATETSIPDVGVPGGSYLLPPGTANRHRRSPSGDDRARWKDRREQPHRQSSEGDDRARWKARNREGSTKKPPDFAARRS